MNTMYGIHFPRNENFWEDEQTRYDARIEYEKKLREKENEEWTTKTEK